MWRFPRILVSTAAIALSVSSAFAEEDPTNIIRKCAPSTNIAAKLEGSAGNLITKRLLGAKASGSIEVFQDGELLKILIEAAPEDAALIYKMYLECVQPSVDSYIEANVASGPLSIKPGMVFEMGIGTTVDIMDGQYLFTVTGIRRGNTGQFYRLLTTLTGLEGRRSQLDYGDVVRLHKTNCRIGFTGVSPNEDEFRFQFNC